jgi:hypothetical protein
MFEVQQSKLLTTLDQTHQEYCQRKEGNWPALYFHCQSLKASSERNFEHFAESSYAMLVSFRMNSGNARMNQFTRFRSSLRLVWEKALQLRGKTPERLNGCDWGGLKEIFWNIRSMDSRPLLVGNSKIMAHLLPELIPPVDGQYVLTFLYEDSTVPEGAEAQWQTLEQVLKGFYYPVLSSPDFKTKATAWLAKDPFRWDTSYLKIIDNLMMELSSK